jgi:RsiW-degrading membrane proteinase PrsW (M82 family)
MTTTPPQALEEEQPLSLETCPYCDHEVPTGAFCGNCGAHLLDEGGRSRLHHFAASPTEHVFRMAVITTFFPHLPRRHAHLFRETFIVGILIVILLSSLRLYAPALIAAVVLLPVLYLLYFYEVEVWKGHQLLVIGGTFGVGALLGVGFSLGFGQVVTLSLNGTQKGPLFSGVLLPVVAEVCMLVGPLLFLRGRKTNEALDGLTFGVASALGFTAASVIAGYWHVLTAPLLGTVTTTTEQISGIVRAAILAGVVNAAATAIICASLWLRHHGRSRKRHDHVVLRLPAAVFVAFGFQIALGLITYYVTSLLFDVILWAIGAALLLVWLRVTIHHALLEEGEELVIGEASACPECHHLVPTMYFCPMCGAARSAVLKPTRQAAGVAPE